MNLSCRDSMEGIGAQSILKQNFEPTGNVLIHVRDKKEETLNNFY